MLSIYLPKETDFIFLRIGVAGLCLLLFVLEPVQAQSRDRSQVHSSPAPPASQQRTGHAARGGPAGRPAPAPGTEVPPATRPASPPSTLGRSPPQQSPGPRAKASTSSPTMPGDPAQAPVDGGLGWLAAAGAAYAANRLRKRGSSGPSDAE